MNYPDRYGQVKISLLGLNQLNLRKLLEQVRACIVVVSNWLKEIALLLTECAFLPLSFFITMTFNIYHRHPTRMATRLTDPEMILTQDVTNWDSDKDFN